MRRKTAYILFGLLLFLVWIWTAEHQRQEITSLNAATFRVQQERDSALAMVTRLRKAMIDDENSSATMVRRSGRAGATVPGEPYDSTPASAPIPAASRLTNLSVLKDVGSGLTTGFTLTGEGPKHVLIRAVGPSLSTFGVHELLLADPKLELFDDQSRSIATNDNWGEAGGVTTATLNAAFAQVGAFTFASSASKDAALLVSLAPGSYTVQVHSTDNSNGVVLVEVYEVPPSDSGRATSSSK